MQTDSQTSSAQTIDKQAAIRQLLHSAIRLIIEEESPLAVHLLILSADRAIIDVANHRGKELRVNWEDWIKPQYHKDFFKKHRSLVNFLKHAENDADATMPLGKIMTRNLMDLYIALANYTAVFGEKTDHMFFFQLFMLQIYPHIIIAPEPLRSSLAQGLVDCQFMTPREFLKLSEQHIPGLPKMFRERLDDLKDIGDFYSLTFSEHRRGITENPRKIRLPLPTA